MATQHPPSDEAEVGSSNYFITGEPLIDPDKPKYLEHPEPKKKKYKNYKNAEKGAPNKDKPTTSDAKKGLKDLPAAMSAVDPSGLSSVAPMMYSMLGQISAAASGSSDSSQKVTTEQALTEALINLSNKYGFDYVTVVFNSAIGDGKLDLIDVEYRDMVKNAIAGLYLAYNAYGNTTLPTTTYNTVKTVGPAPNPVVTVVPNFYVKQYYTPELDPHPGYTEWVSQDGKTIVYTQNQIGDIHYTSATEESYSEAESYLTEALDPYVANNSLTANILNGFIVEAKKLIQQTTQENTGGSSSSSNLMNILTQLAGYVGAITQLQQSIQLPVSVLNKGSITSSQQDFLKNIAEVRRRKALAKQAAQPSSMLSGLGQISGLSSSAQSLYNTIKS